MPGLQYIIVSSVILLLWLQFSTTLHQQRSFLALELSNRLTEAKRSKRLRAYTCRSGHNSAAPAPLPAWTPHVDTGAGRVPLIASSLGLRVYSLCKTVTMVPNT